MILKVYFMAEFFFQRKQGMYFPHVLSHIKLKFSSTLKTIFLVYSISVVCV